MNKLNETLLDWTDIDGAAFEIAKSFGLLTEEQENDFARKAKWIFWSKNKVGDAVYDVLFKMVENKILEMDEEGDQVRWKMKPTPSLKKE
jgi:hypothetical protein